MSTVVKDLGAVSAYAYAVEKGYTGTEAEFAELMADYAEVGQRAEDAADSALESKTAAQTAATTATNKASEATTAATTATTKAGEASTSASTATSAKDTAVSASQTATTKATEATTAAATATSAKTDAVAANTAAQSAKTAAQTAQTGAETAAASVQSSAAQIQTNADDISELKEDFATMESDGVVPSAEQILSDKGVTDSVPYHYRKTGGDGADRLYDQIVGGTVNWNQFVFITSNNETVNGVTYTIDRENGTVTLAGTATANSYLNCNISKPMVEGHKLYIRGCPPNGSAATYNGRDGYVAGDNNKDMGSGAIISAKSNSIYQIQVASGTDVTGKVFKPQIFDLTQMFGSTIADHIYQLEQTTAGAGVALFKSLFPNDYYPYNAGELLSVSGLSEHKMTGFNQWDEEWELGTLPSGQPSDSTTRIRSKGFCSCIPNTAYYFNAPKNGTIYWYDSNENYISYNVGNNAEYTSPSNARFFKIAMGDQYGATYNHDICINLSDPAKNGTYEPYKGHNYPLDSTLTLRGLFNLDANNNLYADGDTYDADGKVTRKYGIVDLGTLTYGYNASYGFYCSASNLPALPKSGTASIAPNAVMSNGFASVTIAITGGRYDKSFSFSSEYLYIADSTYTDTTAFKSAMSGVMLVYELAEPTTEEAMPYQHLQQCDPNGTEEYVSTGIVPIGHNSFYPENLKSKIEGLPWNFASLIAPTESTFTATRNYTTGDLFIVQNVLYKATSNIANGGTITPNTNCTATTLAEIISALA